MPPLNNLSQLKKILIANRGEIACRVIKTARRLGIQTVAVYSEADTNCMHVAMADEAYNIGKPSSQESYLRGDKIIKVAEISHAQAIHPGYGFLSENAEFAKQCVDNGIVFIGPPASAIRDMGIKSTSKNIMESAGVPVVPGYHGEDQSDPILNEKAKEIGFPLMIKAVKGGGGKGMRIVLKETDFAEALESARRESLRAFGDDSVLLERYIKKPRHIEVQIFGDMHRNYVHLFERDCSVQRRHQKVIEQAPAPGISDKIRDELGMSAVKAAAAVNYVGAGTVEFIFDTLINKYYFMEMNTRLQVEHPVTEMVTGIDLVEWQFRVASGEEIPIKQQYITLNGNAVEARIYAENVGNNFLPTAGRIEYLHTPNIESNVRVETGIRSGDDVSVHYDPMIAKLVVWEKEGPQAFRTLENKLSEFNIVGIENNVEFLRKLCKHQDMIEGNVHTGFIEEHRSSLLINLPEEKTLLLAVMGVIYSNKMKFQETDPFNKGNSFRINNLLNKEIKLNSQGREITVNVTYNNDESYDIKIDKNIYRINKGKIENDNEFSNITIETPFNVITSKFVISENKIYIFDKISGDHVFELVNDTDWSKENLGTITSVTRTVSPMPGVIEKINVKKGSIVKNGDPVAVIIAMKMEYVIKAQCDGTVEEIYFSPGDSIGKNVTIMKFSEDKR